MTFNIRRPLGIIARVDSPSENAQYYKRGPIRWRFDKGSPRSHWITQRRALCMWLCAEKPARKGTRGLEMGVNKFEKYIRLLKLRTPSYFIEEYANWLWLKFAENSSAEVILQSVVCAGSLSDV
ncbi:unnamed protein product [Kuraishia capsulata CBS 1993]|uniref:Uncharacterized protein n=1 Tax=Kuraishia capsulata CBS 1993 TaxID=1382522 RepID=W6MN83_9ASCO|nr:uncharacterized protein KUCA_T00004032001 [Kuraishia capsulata CBS 1993]CDK28051.1 unnamed protein product [Kuraishia capsulata CBS 1993]